MFSDIYFYDDEKPYFDCPFSFCVLKDIISEGYLRNSWSFRNGKPTIYGSHSALCFTEMPLYALLDYAKNRENSGLVSNYGIALKKRDLFRMGGRQVIYGLSGKLKIEEPQRSLSEELLPLREQYRYVATTGRVDWTHEREWRWKYDEQDLDEIPGLALWKIGNKPRPRELLIIVKTIDEEEDILDLIKQHYDQKSNTNGYEFDTLLLRKTAVISIERISKMELESKTIRLEDLEPKTLANINLSDTTDFTDDQINLAISQASKIGRVAAEKCRDEMRKRPDSGLIMDVCGFAYVICHEANSGLLNRMRKLNLAQLWIGTGYRIVIPDISGIGGQSLTVDEHGAEAAAKYLTEALGIKFYLHSRMD